MGGDGGSFLTPPFSQSLVEWAFVGHKKAICLPGCYGSMSVRLSSRGFTYFLFFIGGYWHLQFLKPRGGLGIFVCLRVFWFFFFCSCWGSNQICSLGWWWEQDKLCLSAGTSGFCCFKVIPVTSEPLMVTAHECDLLNKTSEICATISFLFFRFQCGNSRIQEHQLHSVGRGRSGQDQTPVAPLLPEHTRWVHSQNLTELFHSSLSSFCNFLIIIIKGCVCVLLWFFS